MNATPAKLVIASEADADLQEAFAWYEERRPGLGEDFLSSVEACLRAICRTPKLHAKVYKDYRRQLVRRFPYSIFYEYERTTVTVYAVVHTSRHPKVWRKRLR